RVLPQPPGSTTTGTERRVPDARRADHRSQEGGLRVGTQHGAGRNPQDARRHARAGDGAPRPRGRCPHGAPPGEPGASKGTTEGERMNEEWNPNMGDVMVRLLTTADLIIEEIAHAPNTATDCLRTGYLSDLYRITQRIAEEESPL